MPRLRVVVAVLPLLLPALACGDPAGPGAVEGVGPRFDGARALALVERQVAFGPRVPGTPGHAAQLAWMLARLDSLAPEVSADTFRVVTTAGDSLTLTNVRARYRPDHPRRILLLAHWDTRPTSDQAPDPSDRDRPVPGANDGGSGTAVLLELARLLAAAPPPVGVDLLLVDGEDYGPGPEDMFLGARRYAERLPSRGPERPEYGVLLDMVGDADPSFPVERASAERAAGVVARVWDLAAELGHGDVFPDRPGPRILDDHLPLLDAGIPTAVVIDFSYGPGHAWWHTPEDTPDKLAASTLGRVGEVMVALIWSGG